MGTGELLGKPNKLRGSDLRWTSIPSRGSRNTPSRFSHATETGISSGSYEPVYLQGLTHFSLWNEYFYGNDHLSKKKK